MTGASSGIGAAVVRRLAREGHELLAIARRAERLESLSAETGARVLPMDVQDLATLSKVVEEFRPDIVVSNAGVGHGMAGLVGLDTPAIKEGVDTNVTAPIVACAAALPGMIARRRGHIINLGSISGLHTMTSALYGATKSAVHMFSQNLRNEVAGTNIRVTEICPGRVASEFYQSAKGKRTRLDQLAKTGIRELHPDDIAEAIHYAVNAPPHVNISTIEILPTDQAVGGVRMASGQD